MQLKCNGAKKDKAQKKKQQQQKKTHSKNTVWLNE